MIAVAMEDDPLRCLGPAGGMHGKLGDAFEIGLREQLSPPSPGIDEGERWIQSATGYARAYVNVLKGLPPLDNINAGSSGLIAAMNGAKDGRKQLEEHAEKLGLPLEAIPTHLPAGHEIYASVWASSWKQIKPAWLDHPKVKGDKVLERTVEAFGTGPYSRWHG